MPRLRLILLGLLALAAVGASTATSASALSVGTRYFVEGAELEAAEAVEGTVETVSIESRIAGVKFGIFCTKNALASSEVESGGKGKGELKFELCKMYEIKNGVGSVLSSCTVKEPVQFKYKSQLVAGPAGEPEIEFKPETGTTIVQFEIAGALCAFKGTATLGGFWYQEWFYPWWWRRFFREVWQYTGNHLTVGPESAAFVGGMTQSLKSGKTIYAGP